MQEPQIKNRTIGLSGVKSRSDRYLILDCLNRKDGVIEVEFDIQKGLLKIKYDMIKINFESIEKYIKEIGFELSHRIVEKWKRGMAKFTERNELDNVKITPASCCSDPKENTSR